MLTGPSQEVICVFTEEEPELQWLKSLTSPLQGEFSCWRFTSDWHEFLTWLPGDQPKCCVVYAHHPATWSRTLQDLAQAFRSPNLPLVCLCDGADDEPFAQTLWPCETLQARAVNSFKLFAAITSALRVHERKSSDPQLLNNDPLTGLITRELLVNRLEQSLARCDRYRQRCALLCINIDQFKSVNEKFGQTVGDGLLREVAVRLLRHCRATDSVARLNGDEFVVLIENADNRVGRKVAAKLQIELASPYTIDNEAIGVTLSMGLASYPDTALSALELLTQAGQALSKAKQDAEVRFVSFSEQHKSQLHRRNTLEIALSRAIEAGDLSLVYQPIVDARTFEVRRLEALSRWPRADFDVPAQELIEMVDRLNLNDAFHAWLFATAFGQLRAWQDESVCPDICLNIPANYCYTNSVAEGVITAINAFGIDPARVELEITESTLMRHPERSIRVLEQLHAEGIRIAVDDFGTGYSSMSYLTSLPIDTLKIDRDFFLIKQDSVRNKKVIEAITALGHSLELTIIAEGVETAHELNLAQTVGCDLLQGYYFGRPRAAGRSWSEYISAYANIPGGTLTPNLPRG